MRCRGITRRVRFLGDRWHLKLPSPAPCHITMLRPGRPYVIINKKSGTALCLSGSDHMSIIGYNYHGGENQKVRLSAAPPISRSVRLISTFLQWILLPHGDDIWTIRGVSGSLISVLGGPRDGAKVTGLMPWQIRPVEGDPDHYLYVQPETVYIHPRSEITASLSWTET